MRTAMVMLALALAGCSQTGEKCTEALKRQLMDPYSAQFENMTVTEHPGGMATVLVWVNAKNSVGAYTGQKLMRCELDQHGQVLLAAEATP